MEITSDRAPEEGNIYLHLGAYAHKSEQNILAYKAWTKVWAMGLWLIGSLSLASCGGNGSGKTQDSSTGPGTEFHADDDIAMTVRSVADAIRVGEPLDTAAYNYEVVLTDGQGRPIYTTLSGTPGKWNVYAASDTTLSLYNAEAGDLLSEDLESYLTAALGVDATNLIDSLSIKPNGGHTLHVYDFDGGRIRFETHTVLSQDDREAAMMIITLAK